MNAAAAPGAVVVEAEVGSGVVKAEEAGCFSWCYLVVGLILIFLRKEISPAVLLAIFKCTCDYGAEFLNCESHLSGHRASFLNCTVDLGVGWRFKRMLLCYWLSWIVLVVQIMMLHY